MKTPLLLLVSALLLCSAALTHAITVDAAQNAAVRSHQPATNYNGATAGAFAPFNQNPSDTPGGLYLTYFNLAGYAGKVVEGDATINMAPLWSEGGYTFNYSSHAVLSNWNEGTVTWDNFIGTTGAAYLAVVGPEMDVQGVTEANDWVNGQPHQWVISNSVIQGWLDNPAQNFGVAILGTGNSFFPSRTYWSASVRPKLEFTLSTSNQPPATPVNQAPTNGAYALPLSPLLRASAYSDPDGHPQAAGWWQLSTDSDFSLVKWESGESSTALTNLTVPASVLTYGTRYFWRVKYRDSDGDASRWSDWSTPTFFDTQLNLIAPVRVVESHSAMIIPGKYGEANPFTFANSNYNGRTDAIFNAINPTTNDAPAGLLMYWFDLSVFKNYAGLAVGGNAELQVSSAYIDESYPSTFDLRALLLPWNETNVTWNNYVGSPWSAWDSVAVGPVLATIVVDAQNSTFTWAVPTNIIQAWLDAPAGNLGLALVPQGTANAQMKTRRTAPPPTLIFDLATTNATTPATPNNIAPVNGTTGLGLMPTLIGSAFSGGSSAQGASQWQIAEDAAMTAIAWDSGAATAATTSISVPSNTLAYTSRYYWRVRYINLEGGKSGWSTPTWFDTAAVGGQFTKRAIKTSMIRYELPDNNWNGVNDAVFNPLNPATNGVPGGVLLAQFDLGPLAGLEVTGPAELRFMLQFTEGAGFLVDARDCHEPWSETNVTWANFVGLANPGNLWSNLGPVQSSATLPADNFPTSCVWTIDTALVQAWIDTPLANRGVALVPQLYCNAQFFSRKNVGFAPTLNFEAVPEPALALLLPLALLLGRRR